MKLTCMVQIYNELETGNLPRFIESVSKYCDALVIYNDGSTDGSDDWICSNKSKFNKKLEHIWTIHGEKNNFKNEIAHKQIMLQHCIELESDWIFWLDCDEVIEKCGEDGKLRELCEMADCDAYGFREINLWRSESFYRLDNAFNAGEFCRLWRNTGKLFYDEKPGLHQRQYPNGIGEIKTSEIKVIHYGFSTDDRILRKYKLYKSHGQTGWELNRLIDERTLRVAKSKQEWFSHKLNEDIFEEIFSVPVASKL